MFIPHRVVQVIHEERIQEALNDAKSRRGQLPHDETIPITDPTKNKWRIGFTAIRALFAQLKQIWNWRLVFQPTNTHLACEPICED